MFIHVRKKQKYREKNKNFPGRFCTCDEVNSTPCVWAEHDATCHVQVAAPASTTPKGVAWYTHLASPSYLNSSNNPFFWRQHFQGAEVPKNVSATETQLHKQSQKLLCMTRILGGSPLQPLVRDFGTLGASWPRGRLGAIAMDWTCCRAFLVGNEWNWRHPTIHHTHRLNFSVHDSWFIIRHYLATNTSNMQSRMKRPLIKQ